MQMNEKSRRLATNLVRSGVIKPEYLELYAQAAEMGLMILLNILTTLAAGFFLDMQWQSILLLCAVIPLRSYTGGYHTQNYFRCYFASTGVTVAALLFLKFENSVTSMEQTLITVFFVAIAVIFCFAPQPDGNRKLTLHEKQVFRKRTEIMTIVESATAVILFLFHQEILGAVLMMSVIICAGALILKVFQNNGFYSKSKKL